MVQLHSGLFIRPYGHSALPARGKGERMYKEGHLYACNVHECVCVMYVGVGPFVFKQTAIQTF